MTLAADSKMIDGVDVVMEVRVPGRDRGIPFNGTHLFEAGRKLKLVSFDGKRKAVFEMVR